MCCGTLSKLRHTRRMATRNLVKIQLLVYVHFKPMVKVHKLKWNMHAAKAQLSMRGNPVYQGFNPPSLTILDF